jgi:FKBP-type peptidyl-prolyl cis-trans isomerase (trigger factor)
MKIKINKLPKSEVEIELEIEQDTFESYFSKAIQKLGEHTEVDGFRKGKAPESVLLAQIPEMKVLEEMAQMAFMDHYPKILEQEKIDAIGNPIINITKIARNNPLELKIQTAILPEIILPDYKKLSKEIISKVTPEEKNTEVTEEEMENTILDIRKSRSPKKHITEEVKEGEDKKETKEELVEFNDDFIRALGPFENIEDFKNKLRENIKIEKENILKEKTRLKIVEKIIEETKTEVPEILTNAEVEKILYKMESDIAQMGLKFDEYLKHINKTIDDMRAEFKKDGEKKAKLGLVLNKIAEVEKIVPDEMEVAKEVDNIMATYKDADKERATIHVHTVLTNEKIFQMLENQ